MDMGKHIFIIDDDVAILEVIQIILKDAGYTTTVVGEGDVLKRISSERPDLILLDIWMSGLDGTQIARTLKQNESTSSIPIIMISANNEGVRLAKKSGADGFIAKPFEIDELLNVVARYLPDSNKPQRGASS